MVCNMRRQRASISILLIASLLLICGASPSEKWEQDIAAFEAADKASPPPQGAIVFVGSSTVRLWKTLAEDFPHHNVINRGFGGSELADSVHFADRIVTPYKPRLIVLFAGTNDINAGKSPEQVFSDFKAFVTSQGVKMDAQAFEADLVFIKAMIRYDIDLALFGVAAARKHLIETDPQAQFAVSLFREAEQLTQLARAKAARNEQR